MRACALTEVQSFLSDASNDTAKWYVDGREPLNGKSVGMMDNANEMKHDEREPKRETRNTTT